MIAVFFHCVVRADVRGNVNRKQNKWHQAPVRLEIGGTSFPRKITPLPTHRGKVSRCDCNFEFLYIRTENKIQLIQTNALC